MAKKTKKLVKKNKKAKVNKELVNKIRWLNVLIAASLKQVKGDESVQDQIFGSQASRLMAELGKLKEKQ